nr:MAG TPA: hypothetical protein [Bacteriophage sp.]
MVPIRPVKTKKASIGVLGETYIYILQTNRRKVKG